MSRVMTSEEQRVSRDYSVFLAAWGNTCFLSIKHMLFASRQTFSIHIFLSCRFCLGPPQLITKMIIPGRGGLFP